MKSSLEESLKVLGIEDYKDRIINSNSHGELFHLQDYFMLADAFRDNELIIEMFPSWFEVIIKTAEEEWERPESVFQHIPRLLKESLLK